MSTNGSATGRPSNGTMSHIPSLTNGKPAMAYALNGIKRSNSQDTWSPASSSAASETEDYDDLRFDPDTVVPDGEGAGVEKHQKSRREESPASSGSSASETLRIKSFDGVSKGKYNRRKSVQVTIEKSGKKGKYTLTADDPEFRDILRHSIEREAAKLSGKKSRTRFRDLVFTRQFTTFDRQNPRSASSPFHGFFTLFWLSMALLLMKIAAQNYRNEGSVFGGAEILHLMVRRDLFLVFVVDGMMTFGTAFSLVLQKIISKGYLTWNGSGWVIQSLWQIFFVSSVIWLTFYRDWPWTHTVFIVLHAIVYLMKQHSYSFYNGYRKCFNPSTILNVLTFNISITSLSSQAAPRTEIKTARRNGKHRKSNVSRRKPIPHYSHGPRLSQPKRHPPAPQIHRHQILYKFPQRRIRNRIHGASH